VPRVIIISFIVFGSRWTKPKLHTMSQSPLTPLKVSDALQFGNMLLSTSGSVAWSSGQFRTEQIMYLSLSLRISLA